MLSHHLLAQLLLQHVQVKASAHGPTGSAASVAERTGSSVTREFALPQMQQVLSRISRATPSQCALCPRNEAFMLWRTT